MIRIIKALAVLLLISFGWTNPSFANPLDATYCVEEFDRCFHLGTGALGPTIFTDGKPIGQETAGLLRSLGFSIRAPFPNEVAEWSSQPAVPVYRISALQQAQALESASDATFDQWAQGASCGVAAGACVVGTYATLATGGIALLAAELGCATAIIECVKLIEGNNRLRRAKERADLAKKLSEHDPSSVEGGPGSIRSGPGMPPTPGPSCRWLAPYTVITKDAGGVETVTHHDGKWAC